MKTKLTRLTRCPTCTEKIGDKKALDCQLCQQWVCLPCTGVSTATYEFLTRNNETMHFLCQSCKEEIPSLRELKSIKDKQAKLEADITKIKKDAVDTDKAVDECKATQEAQGAEIKNHEAEIKDLIRRLDDVESKQVIIDEAGQPQQDSYAQRAGRASNQIETIVRTQMSEQAEIEKLKKNLVISGIAETPTPDEDKAKVLELIEKELEIRADIEQTVRIGKPRQQKPGEDPPQPRLIKIVFVTQRSRREVLVKNTKLRKSADEHVKEFVYIRPDMTKLQLEESKNLRDQLRKTKDENPNKIYKIHRGEIIEVAPPTPATPEPAPPADPTHQAPEAQVVNP